MQEFSQRDLKSWSVAEVAELEKPNKNGKERITQKTCRVNMIKPPLFGLNFPH
jgi:hypothetical protein